MFILTTINRGHRQSPRFFNSFEEACTEARFYVSCFTRGEAYVAEVSNPDNDLYAVFGTEGDDE